MRWLQAFRYDVKMQWRQGFYLIYAIVSAIYVLLLRQLPGESRETAALLLTFSDPSVLGFYFIGGLVLLEKALDLFGPLFVTPYTPRQYIWAKTLSLTLLSVTAALVIHLGVFGWGEGLADFCAGAALTSVFFTMMGMGFAIYCRSMNGFFFLGTLGTILFISPILEAAGVGTAPFFAFLPAKAGLVLLAAPSDPPGWGERLAAVVMLVLWILLAELWVRHAFRRRMLAVGGGRMT
ncbi:ABC transporter permease [Brevibacillus borstelensis]|uniref:fluoroquinolone export ABC transporter permease subunit n=1 Tax=Brevibacillus borstelensis TaxID=45462 RepID=UPI0030C3DD2A